MTRVENTGEITTDNGEILLKMWHAIVEPEIRGMRLHNHTRFEITLVASGSGIYSTPTGIFHIQKGDVLVFSGNEWHCITEIHEDGLELINLHFEPRFLLGSSHNSLSARHMNFCFAHSPNFKNHIPAKDAQFLAQLICNIENELTAQHDEYILCAKSYLNLLLISLIRDHDYCAKASNPRMSEILKALKFIDAHFTEPITLEEIASVAGVTPTYFSSVFKEVCNVTLWNYITNKRIEKASRMILEEASKDTMLDIAIACGFNNTANFNKAFRKFTGMTPSNYRTSKDSLLH